MNITYFELLLGAEDIWLYCDVTKLIWGWETVVDYSYQSLCMVLQSTCKIWKKKDANNILMWYLVFNLLYAAEYYSWAKSDQKVGSLLHKETEGNLNFKLCHLSLSIDWVFLIKINFELEYHYLLISPESMPFSYLGFFLFFPDYFLFLIFSPILAASKEESLSCCVCPKFLIWVLLEIFVWLA